MSGGNPVSNQASGGCREARGKPASEPNCAKHQALQKTSATPPTPGHHAHTQPVLPGGSSPARTPRAAIMQLGKSSGQPGTLHRDIHPGLCGDLVPGCGGRGRGREGSWRAEEGHTLQEGGGARGPRRARAGASEACGAAGASPSRGRGGGGDLAGLPLAAWGPRAPPAAARAAATPARPRPLTSRRRPRSSRGSDAESRSEAAASASRRRRRHPAVRARPLPGAHSPCPPREPETARAPRRPRGGAPARPCRAFAPPPAGACPRGVR